MKYNKNNKPLVCMMTQSTCYKGTRKFTPKGVLWHSTGANNPNLKRYVQPDDNAGNRAGLLRLLGTNANHNDWNHSSVQAGLNFWIGKLADGTVAAVQTMPWDYRPWGCGSGSKGSGNDIYIQFEICEDGLDDESYFNAAYKEACEMTAYLCKMFGIDPKGRIAYNGMSVPAITDHTGSHSLGIGSNHGDVQHWFRRYGKTMDDVRNDVAAMLKADTEASAEGQKTAKADKKLCATDLKGLSQKDVVKRVGPLFTADQKKTGVLASVSLAQFCLESAYGTSELALNANNCFGMKKSLSGNTWAGSTWDGKSVYTKKTQEQNSDGRYKTITADFRKYPSIADSIADHSAYLTGAMNGKKLRYAGLKGCTDYKKAAQIIKDGGYATSKDYVKNLCALVERWKLTQCDAPAGSSSIASKESVAYYRVRKSWKDKASQIGAFTVLENAKLCADANPGYAVFDDSGNQVYPKAGQSFTPYRVRVSISDLNYRKGPSTSYASWGHIKPGIYTIVEEQDGWGLLKAYADKRNGWISLRYASRV